MSDVQGAHTVTERHFGEMMRAMQYDVSEWAMKDLHKK